MNRFILIIDDDPIMRLVASEALKPYDCDVLQAVDGKSGLVIAARNRPRLILLDYSMPGMDGTDVLSMLRLNRDLADTPVIMLTSESERSTVLEAVRLGVCDYLIKPIKMELLVQRINRVVKLQPKALPPTVDPLIRILVMDDRPAIAKQIRAGLADTPWLVLSTDDPGQLDSCLEHGVDVVFVDLSLPNDGAYLLFEGLRKHPNTAAVPVFGLSVKTATIEHSRAQRTGFLGIITKPIDIDNLKAMVRRVLKLGQGHQCFTQVGGALVMTISDNLDNAAIAEISASVNNQITSAVDAGAHKFIMDLSGLSSITPPVVELGTKAFETSNRFALKHAVVCSEAIKASCNGRVEAQSWLFAESVDQALSSLNEEEKGADSGAPSASDADWLASNRKNSRFDG